MDYLSFSPEIEQQLRTYFRVEDTESLERELGIDIHRVYMSPPKHLMETTQNPKRSLELTRIEEWGIQTKAVSTGNYWVFTHHPLADAESVDELEFPNVDLPGRFDRAAEYTKKYGQMLAIAGMMEVTLFEQAWWLRGYRKFIQDMYTNPKFANDLLDRLLELRIQEAKKFVEIGVDIIRIGDDVGMQTGMILPPSIWRKYLKPRTSKLIREIKKQKDVYVQYHSDGNIEPIIPELIEIGLDILNPVQPDCMDLVKLKRLYGDALTFHGCVSVQETLPFAMAEQVKNVVTKSITSLGYNGGLILAPSHHLDNDIPLENVLALYETAKKLSYPVA